MGFLSQQRLNQIHPSEALPCTTLALPPYASAMAQAFDRKASVPLERQADGGKASVSVGSDGGEWVFSAWDVVVQLVCWAPGGFDSDYSFVAVRPNQLGEGNTCGPAQPDRGMRLFS